MSGIEKNMPYPLRICLRCKHFFFDWQTQDPKSQRCKKYNRTVAMFGYAGKCKDFREKEE